MEKTWELKLEEARKEKRRETAEATCQADETESSSGTITVEELDSRLSAQKQQLQLEADKVKHKAVEEARKQTQRELHKKHLEDMAKLVSGIFYNTLFSQRAYCFFISAANLTHICDFFFYLHNFLLLQHAMLY